MKICDSGQGSYFRCAAEKDTLEPNLKLIPSRPQGTGSGEGTQTGRDAGWRTIGSDASIAEEGLERKANTPSNEPGHVSGATRKTGGAQ